jgi:hypothetical protein
MHLQRQAVLALQIQAVAVAVAALEMHQVVPVETV